MYRDGVFGPSDVYVVCGTNAQGGGHAWVTVRLPIIGWYTIEPQANGVIDVFLGNPLLVSGYQAIYKFNDQQCVWMNGTQTS